MRSRVTLKAAQSERSARQRGSPPADSTTKTLCGSGLECGGGLAPRQRSLPRTRPRRTYRVGRGARPLSGGAPCRDLNPKPAEHEWDQPSDSRDDRITGRVSECRLHVRVDAGALVKSVAIEEYEGPQASSSIIPRLLKSERLVKGALTGFIIRDQHLLTY